MSSKTFEFYETNASDLIDRYESADMSALHKQLVKHIQASSKVIDIGFGSGRDLAFLQSKGFDIYGIDPLPAFVMQAQHRFPKINNHFRIGSFLSLNTPDDWQKSFDAVISIAVWMHLNAHEHSKAIDSIKSLLKPNGIVILSFSIGGRESNDGRHFEPLELHDVIETFKNAGFYLIESQCTPDSLGRDAIKWATVVMKR